MNTTDPIDVVITWVNGSSEFHQRLRQKYISQTSAPLHLNAINPHRWACNDEILYCLQSIENFAPWIRKIWIVVDREIPDLSILSKSIIEKTQFVFHSNIFEEFSDALPTFNSLAIESMIWRINGLSERFIYFNDDVFLTAPLFVSDIFEGGLPVLRGEWVDYSGLNLDTGAQTDPSKFNHFMQLNAAGLLGLDGTKMWSSAHVIHPLRRTVMQQLFNKYQAAFSENVRYRFRDLNQFLPQGLHNQFCILNDEAVINTVWDHRHIFSGQSYDAALAKIWAELGNTSSSRIKMLCINDLPQLAAIMPTTYDWLGKAIGGFQDNGQMPGKFSSTAHVP